ncbi:MAG TPA: outer membrane beta-barrel protein, partial [Pseudolabrys sp.]|nr:outer membrane beta-barrel protein [Pseudolabrys sp.]
GGRTEMSARISITMGLAAALAAAAMAPSAQAQVAYYLGAEGGWTSLSSTKDTLATVPNKRTYNDGFNAGVRGGLQYGPWRFEEEYSYRENGNNNAQIGALISPGGTAGGSRTANAIMTNVIYDFAVGWPVTPHIGGGVGAVEINDTLSFPHTGQIANSSDWEFGYQAIAGIRYEISPSLALDLDYRYLATTDATFHTRPFTTGGVAVPSIKYTSGYSTNSLLASLTYRFGAAPPPAPVLPPPTAAPPPPPPQAFIVFFNWDSAAVTPEGMQIVHQAADAYRAGGAVHLQVTGYTDRSGSPGYNQRLSERRADNVANALAGLGVPRSDMLVSGRGENDNRVPTADGVREPQNRRVEVTS